MALRLLWDEQETAILVDYYKRFTRNECTRREAISKASIELRNRAVRNGIEIDDTFRNENGISMQMTKIEDLFVGGKRRLSKAPQVFENVVNLYLNDRDSFNRILREARGEMSNNNGTLSVEEEFFHWLSGKISPAQMSELYFVYTDIEAYFLEKGILKTSLFNTTDLSVIETIRSTVESNKIFRFTYRKQIGKMQSAIKHYCDFIKEKYSCSNDDVMQNIALATKKDEILPERVTEASNPVKVTEVPKTAKTLDMPKAIEPITETPTIPISEETQQGADDNTKVTFDSAKTYAFTRPDRLSYFGDDYEVKNWTQLYVQVMNCLFEDYPDDIRSLCVIKTSWNGRADISDASKKHLMTAPKEFVDGLFIETNLSATDIVRKIKKFLDICRVDYENVVITYHSEKFNEAPEKKAAAPSQTGDILIDFLIKHDVEYIDNRDKKGCLWIIGSDELDNIVKYCRMYFGVIFRFKDSARALKGKNGWWTYDQAKSQDITKKVIASPRSMEANEQSTSTMFDNKITSIDSFTNWMTNASNLAPSSARSYASGIRNCEQLAIQKGLDSTKLYDVAYIEAANTANLLLSVPEISNANNSQYRWLRAALTKFLQYISGDTSSSTGSQTRSYHMEAQSSAPSKDLALYENVLKEYFPKGYRAESNLDLKRFIRYYNAMHGTELDIGNETVKEKTKQNILQAGIRHDDYIYAADCLLDDSTKNHVISYIEESFSSGKQALYYRALFEEFNNEFLDQKIYDEDMLRTFLIHECGGKYVFERSYMSKERNVQVDPKDEVKRVLIMHGSPMQMESIYAALPHLPTNKIDWALHSNKEFISNTWREYFHISLIDLSDDELADISEIILREIDESHFISGNELINVIKKKHPGMLERFPEYSMTGLRDAIAYYLGNEFSFNGNIISAKDKQMSMNDVFAEFARTHYSFTIDELNMLKSEMNSTIYFDAVYENSMRVSQNQFVSMSEADFNIPQTDKAISVFTTKSYMSLADVTSFSAFPYAGYPWNIFLLEYYVATYSADYKLLHTGFNAEKCVGAIVERTSGIDTFNDLIVLVLADSGIDFNKDSALQYLCDHGYLARKKYSDIDKLIIKARAKKG